MTRPLWTPGPRHKQPSYGAVPLDILRWSMGRGDFTCREASEALGVGYRVAVRGVNTLADLGFVVDVGKLRQATVWNCT